MMNGLIIVCQRASRDLYHYSVSLYLYFPKQKCQYTGRGAGNSPLVHLDSKLVKLKCRDAGRLFNGTRLLYCLV